MPSALCVSHLSATPRVLTISGIATTNLGGPFRREGAMTGNSVYEAKNSLAAKNQNDVFAVHNMRYYQFRADVFYVPVGSYGSTQAAFHGFSAGDTWSASGGATGTFAEDGFSTDTFVQLVVNNGTVGLGEIITITSGAAINETAVSTAAQSQGGDVGSEGEWVVVFKPQTTPKAAYSYSGIFPIRIGSELGLCSLFISSTDFIHAVTYTPSMGWAESGQIDATGDTVSDRFGVGSVLEETLSMRVNATVGKSAWYFYNPTTGTGSKVESTNLGTNSGNVYTHNSRCVMWRGGVYAFVVGANPSSPANIIGYLIKLSGGAWTVVRQLNSTVSAANIFAPSSGRPIQQLFVNNGSLYAIYVGQNNAPNPDNFGVVLTRFFIDGANVSTDTFNDVDVANDKFSQDMLGVAIGQSPSPNAGLAWINAMARFIQDSETNNPDGIQRTFLYLSLLGVGAANSMELFLFEGFKDVTDVTYTWNGTNTIVTSGQSSILPGSWVKIDNDPSKPSFRVSSVTANSLLIEQINSIPIPSGNGIRAIPPLGFVSQGSSGGINQLAFPSVMPPSGGNFFTKGQNTIDIVSHAKAIDAVQFTLKPEGGGTMVVRLYHGVNGVDPEVQSPLKNPSSGTLVVEGSAHRITGIVADGTPFTVELDLVAAGLNPGDVKGVTPRISLT